MTDPDPDLEWRIPWHRGYVWALPNFVWFVFSLLIQLVGRGRWVETHGLESLGLILIVVVPVIAGAVDGAWRLVRLFLLTWYASLALMVALASQVLKNDDGLGVGAGSFFLFWASLLYPPLVHALFGLGRLVGRLVRRGAGSGWPRDP